MRIRESFFIRGQDILEVRIKDEAKSISFKARANVHDKKRIKQIFEDLEGFGVNVREIMNLQRLKPVEKPKQEEKKEEPFKWFLFF